jgi:hypothetical protein
MEREWEMEGGVEVEVVGRKEQTSSKDITRSILREKIVSACYCNLSNLFYHRIKKY